MDDADLDMILAIIGNPTRRSILRKLSRETHYPLQLSRELNISQQSIMKHLKVLEDHDMVMSIVQKSDSGGPPRKYYVSTSRFSIVIDIAPSVFNEQIRVFEIVPESRELLSEKEELDKREMAEKRELLIG
ncbi:MAG: helix-turn-helix domain-containing protein, partial [Thermoplasmata archaeon]|nr:helix-turn-helix domain-containing protein [Thermoplasmata archaeon]